MDYFNETERAGQRSWAVKRDRFFRPIVDRAIRIGMTPNRMSILGVLLLVAGASLPRDYFPLMMILVSLYVVTDGLDGCMARVLEKTSEGGSLVDIVVDQAGPVVIAAAAALHIPSHPAIAVIFSNSYLIFIGLFLYANENNIPMKGTFYRVKYVLYIFYALSFIIKYDLMTWFMGLFSIYYIVALLVVLTRIYNYYDKRGAVAAGNSEDRPAGQSEEQPEQHPEDRPEGRE
ncbi:MAG: CDP-alcohol phosphatidyltransferase family protein [Deltaproteobacteria bacterium]|jgi:phosphatidylglycerophosphate synthase|nr:CDP-alcohol phosphatidyltransferase family protein [Deltaproteobacteria bacterium]